MIGLIEARYKDGSVSVTTHFCTDKGCVANAADGDTVYAIGLLGEWWNAEALCRECMEDRMDGDIILPVYEADGTDAGWSFTIEKLRRVA